MMLLCFCSCQRRDLNDDVIKDVKIKVSIDWSKAGLDPDNDPDKNLYSVSLWFYPKDGSEPFLKGLSDPRGGEIAVPVGSYSVIVMNNRIEDYTKMKFENQKNFEQFRVVGIPSKSLLRASKSDGYIQEPEVLAVKVIEDFEITKEMLHYVISKQKNVSKSELEREYDIESIEKGFEQLQNIQPQRLFNTLNIKVKIKNLKSAKSSLGTFSGMSSGVYIATGKTLTESVKQEFVLNNRTYDEGSTINGTIEAKVLTFGRIGTDGKYKLEVVIKTVDDTIHNPFVFDVSKEINKAIPTGVESNIFLIIGEENPIILPDINVPGDIELEDWSDIIDIPIGI